MDRRGSVLRLTWTTSSGFTIVELLIVIVVIAILAALVLNNFSGVQLKARNAQTFHAVEAYKKGLEEYATVNGAYPNYNWWCLGQGYPGGKCWGGNSYENQAMSDALRTTMGSTLPLGSGPNLLAPGVTAGLVYTSPSGPFTLDGKPTAFIFYVVEGPNPFCQVGPIVSGTGWPNFLTSNPVGSTSNGVNECFVPLPQP